MTSHNIKCPTGDRKQRLPILIFMLITIIIAINRIIGHNIISTEDRGRRLRDEQFTASERLGNETSVIIHVDEAHEELLPCSEILLRETADERCKYSQHCEGEFLMEKLLPLVFCTDPSTPSPLNKYPVLQIFFPVMFPMGLMTTTLLLFRLLGSTAENYFSPALDMLCSEFDIPPALAGVTLLALGNGAPDISAVVNAIKTNAQEGIPLSLGELTGGGMFVQSIVVGRIVMLGSSKTGAISCGKELIRDISMYAVAATYVFWMVGKGRIHYRHVIAMLFLYFGYVAIVVFSELRRDKNSDETDGNEDSNLALSPSADEEDQVVELCPKKKFHQSKLPDPPGSKYSSRVLRIMKLQQKKQKRRNSISGSIAQDQMPSKRIVSPWSLGLLSEALKELRGHFHQTIQVDILSNNFLSNFEWHCMLLEIPFIIIRKLVTPITCEEEYNRALVGFSIALSPFWCFFYLSTKLEGNSFDARLQIATIMISFALGATIIRCYEKAADMPLKYRIAVALYGFLVAATWIDLISEHLVNVLELIGVIMRIPAPVMGATVLAWGNSVGDWTTNGALAQRGLADMSMAACFAGPSFNLLVGLGFGLLTQHDSLMSDQGLAITLSPTIQIGFFFLISNCIAAIASSFYHGGTIPKTNAYVFWTFYFLYMATSAQNL